MADSLVMETLCSANWRLRDRCDLSITWPFRRTIWTELFRAIYEFTRKGFSGHFLFKNWKLEFGYWDVCYCWRLRGTAWAAAICRWRWTCCRLLGFNVCRDFFFAYAAVTLLPVATERNERAQKRRDGLFCYISAAAIDVKRVERWLHTPTDSVNFGSRRGATTKQKLFLLFRETTRGLFVSAKWMRVGLVRKSNVTTSEAKEWMGFSWKSRMNGQHRPK